MKKITRNTLASLAAAGSALPISGVVPVASHSEIANTATKPRMNFGKRSQISPAFALSVRGVMWLVQM